MCERSRLGSLRSSYFWTQVNRPIAAVSLNAAGTQLMRQNLGQIVSKGVTVEAETRPFRWLSVTAGYQYANSTVTKFPANAQFPANNLVGKWTPQVARNLATAQVRLEKERVGVITADLRVSGQQFDDSANQFLLEGYTQVDLYAEHSIKPWLQLYTLGAERWRRTGAGGTDAAADAGHSEDRRLWRAAGIGADFASRTLKFCRML